MPLSPHISRNQKNKLIKKAFSLVELLIAVSIFSVVSIAIYSTLNSGLVILRRANEVDIAQQRILIKEERIARELREQQPCRKFLFFGTRTRISFAAISDYAPCRVTYYFDSSRKSLMRAVEGLTEILTPEGLVDREVKTEERSVFLKDIKEASFAYLYFDLAKNGYTWAEEWPNVFPPVAVRITVIDKKGEYAKRVFLPTS